MGENNTFIKLSCIPPYNQDLSHFKKERKKKWEKHKQMHKLNKYK